MMRMSTATEPTSRKGGGLAAGTGDGDKLEVRPGGMLVQKRDPDAENWIPPPTIRVRVKYKSVYHEINISSQATFGELKKMLRRATGLHHEDQKLIYKDKERDSKTFLDVVGVKDRSKMVLTEDPISQERRYVEKKKNAKMEKAAKSISQVTLEVDSLVAQASALESVISKGGKVAEKMVTSLIELFMNQLLVLDGIMADGDVNLQKRKQVKRIQEHVEALDVLKVKNSNATKPPSPIPLSNGQDGITSPTHHHHHRPPQQKQPLVNDTSTTVVVTTQWETFDSMPPPPTTSATRNLNNTIHPMFNWDLL